MDLCLCYFDGDIIGLASGGVWIASEIILLVAHLGVYCEEVGVFLCWTPCQRGVNARGKLQFYKKGISYQLQRNLWVPISTTFVGRVVIIDGGLATELERHGADLNDSLWSAKCLLTSPNLVRAVHLDYLQAGADIIITASYQATIQGFEAKGFSSGVSESLIRKSLEIACEARDIYYDRCQEGSPDGNNDGRVLKQWPILVAASVGSDGAYLADGSEYSGNYGDAITLETLKDFHRRRIQILAESGADLISFETVPNKVEAQAYAELLKEEDIKIFAWFSFNSKDGVNVISGNSLLDCASIANS